MTNPPSEPREFWIMDSGLKYTAEIEKPLEYLSYVAHVIEYSAFEKLQAENAELQAKYNFMVDSAQQNAKERDACQAQLYEFHRFPHRLRETELREENKKLQAEFERARLDREHLELVNKDYFEQLERAKAQLLDMQMDRDRFKKSHAEQKEQADELELMAESYRAKLSDIVESAKDSFSVCESCGREDSIETLDIVYMARAALEDRK